MDRPVDAIPVEAMRGSRPQRRASTRWPWPIPQRTSWPPCSSGSAVNELRGPSRDMASVLERRPELIALVPRLAGEAGLATGGVPAGTVVDAGSALRIRELRAAPG